MGLRQLILDSWGDAGRPWAGDALRLIAKRAAASSGAATAARRGVPPLLPRARLRFERPFACRSIAGATSLGCAWRTNPLARKAALEGVRERKLPERHEQMRLQKSEPPWKSAPNLLRRAGRAGGAARGPQHKVSALVSPWTLSALFHPCAWLIVQVSPISIQRPS